MTKVRMLRALNDLDIKIDPLKNGINSKVIIYEAVKKYLIDVNKNLVDNMTEKELKHYIESKTNSFIVENMDILGDILDSMCFDLKDVVKSFNDNNISARNYILAESYLSSLLGHIRNGSTIPTDWISSTVSLSALYKYYCNQKINKVALIETDTNNLMDDYTFCVNLTNKDIIERLLSFLPKKIDKDFAELWADLSVYRSGLGNIFRDDYIKSTSLNFPGFNYSTKDKEVCFYNRIPSSKVINVLGKLEMDLIYKGILSPDYLMLSKSEQEKKLHRIKVLLFVKIKKDYNLRLQRAFNELYFKNSNDASLEKEKIKILQIASSIKSKY